MESNKPDPTDLDDNSLKINQTTSQSSMIYERKYNEKLEELQKGYLKVESALSVLCGTGIATCVEKEEKPACYGRFGGNFGTLGLDFDSFGMVAENSLPVCVKNDQVSDSPPSCSNNTVPVCGVKNDVSSLISEGQVVCPVSGTSGVVCPFGGRPACVMNKNKDKKAYCISNNNIVISTSDRYGQSYNISCNDAISKPECISYISKSTTVLGENGPP